MEYNINGQDQYSCSCQDTGSLQAIPGRQDGCLRLSALSRVHACLTTKKSYRETQSSLPASLHKQVFWFLRKWKAHWAPGVVNSNLRNLCHVSVKAARPGQLCGSLKYVMYMYAHF